MLHDDEIGGAYVRRPFTRGEDHLYGGQLLSGDEVRAIRQANRKALIDAGFIEVFPRGPVEMAGDRAMVHIGAGRYDVFAGKVNTEPLTKEEAEDLATRPQ